MQQAVQSVNETPRTPPSIHAIPTRIGRVVIETTGQGLPLFVLHSVTHDRRDYDAVAGELAEHFRVVAVDLPGHGASDMFDPPSSASASKMCQAVEDVADALKLGPAIFMGNSVGGNVGAYLAIHRPELVKGLVLIDSAAVSGQSAVTRAACWIQGRHLVRRLTGRLFTRSYLKHRNAWTEAILERNQQARVRAGFLEMDAAMWRSFGAPDTDLSAEAHRIAAPTMVVWGARDPVLRASVEGRNTCARIPHASYAELDTGHVPFAEDPQGFLEKVLPFLLRLRH